MPASAAPIMPGHPSAAQLCGLVLAAAVTSIRSLSWSQPGHPISLTAVGCLSGCQVVLLQEHPILLTTGVYHQEPLMLWCCRFDSAYSACVCSQLPPTGQALCRSQKLYCQFVQRMNLPMD